MKKINLVAFVVMLLVFTSCVNHGDFDVDSDNDGVADDIDLCSDTPEGEAVDANGCMLRTYVPDDAFEQLLIDLGYDDILDDYVLTSHINTVEKLSITRNDLTDAGNITDLTGLEGFTALSDLYIYAIGISEFDSSVLPNLTILNLVDVPIVSLDIAEHAKLERLLISDLYALEILDIGDNPELNRVEIQYSSIENGTNVFGNPKLMSIVFFDSSTPSMLIDSNADLETIGSEGATIDDMVINNNGMLSSILLLPGSKVYKLGIIGSPVLKNLYVPGGELSALDVSGFPELETLDVTYNPLTCIQVNQAQLNDIPEEWSKDAAASYALECSGL